MKHWSHILKTQRQAKYPTENFVRFVARNYYDVSARDTIKFLDLGCGAGANTLYLRNEGFNVIAVDNAECSLANLHADILDLNFETERFDCILDNNTLCHIEDFPFEKIKWWLKDNGKFFSVCPTSETWRGTLEGKGYCRCATKREIEQLYSEFSKLEIGRACYPDRGHEISSWVIEALR